MKLREKFLEIFMIVVVAVVVVMIGHMIIFNANTPADVIMDTGRMGPVPRIYNVARIIKEDGQFKIVLLNGETIYTGNATIRILNPDIVIEEADDAVQ